MLINMCKLNKNTDADMFMRCRCRANPAQKGSQGQILALVFRQKSLKILSCSRLDRKRNTGVPRS